LGDDLTYDFTVNGEGAVNGKASWLSLDPNTSTLSKAPQAVATVGSYVVDSDCYGWARPETGFQCLCD
jgi:hypothetical protein